MRRRTDGRYSEELAEPSIRILENIEARPITSRQRTGRAFLIDTFENYTTAATEKWKQISGTIALATDYPKQGKKCMTLTTGTTAADTSDASRYMGAFPKGRFGIEYDFFSSSAVANITRLRTQIIYYDGTDKLTALIQWLGTTNKKWQYWNTTAGYADISGGTQNIYVESTYVPCYHNLKFVADFKTEKLVKLICDEKELDLSTLSMDSTSETSIAPMLAVSISIVNATSTTARVLYVDNVILTDQEP